MMDEMDEVQCHPWLMQSIVKVSRITWILGHCAHARGTRFQKHATRDSLLGLGCRRHDSSRYVVPVCLISAFLSIDQSDLLYRRICALASTALAKQAMLPARFPLEELQTYQYDKDWRKAGEFLLPPGIKACHRILTADFLFSFYCSSSDRPEISQTSAASTQQTSPSGVNACTSRHTTAFGSSSTAERRLDPTNGRKKATTAATERFATASSRTAR